MLTASFASTCFPNCDNNFTKYTLGNKIVSVEKHCQRHKGKHKLDHFEEQQEGHGSWNRVIKGVIGMTKRQMGY
jgi:hypothetical protein